MRSRTYGVDCFESSSVYRGSDRFVVLDESLCRVWQCLRHCALRWSKRNKSTQISNAQRVMPACQCRASQYYVICSCCQKLLAHSSMPTRQCRDSLYYVICSCLQPLLADSLKHIYTGTTATVHTLHVGVGNDIMVSLNMR